SALSFLLARRGTRAEPKAPRRILQRPRPVRARAHAIRLARFVHGLEFAVLGRRDTNAKYERNRSWRVGSQDSSDRGAPGSVRETPSRAVSSRARADRVSRARADRSATSGTRSASASAASRAPAMAARKRKKRRASPLTARLRLAVRRPTLESASPGGSCSPRGAASFCVLRGAQHLRPRRVDSSNRNSGTADILSAVPDLHR